jgi:hypothetical protein
MEYQSTGMSGESAYKQTLSSPNEARTGPPSMKQDPIPTELCETCIHGIEVCNAPIYQFISFQNNVFVKDRKCLQKSQYFCN